MELEKALLQKEPGKDMAGKDTWVCEEHFLPPSELTEDELMKSVFANDQDEKVDDRDEKRIVAKGCEELFVEKNSNVVEEFLSGVLAGDQVNSDEEAMISHVSGGGGEDDVITRDGGGDGGNSICKSNCTNGRKGNSKAEKRRQGVEIEVGKKNEDEEVKKKYGQCPECDRNYGKDLWRHLRTVERWSEEKIKGTYAKKQSKVANPSRYDKAIKVI